MYNQKLYIDFVKNNQYLTNCQKSEFINTKRQKFYIDNKSDKQIVAYISHSHDDLLESVRVYVLFNHFLKLDFVNKLLSKIKEKKYSDTKIYEYIMSHPEALQKHKKQGQCSQYTYTFEKLSLILWNKYLNSENKSNIKYLDVACGNGSKTKLFSDKLGLLHKNVYGSDIEEWGPYKSESKSKMPIQFKLLENNKLDFPDNEFDILSIFLALHHIPIDQLPKILNEFKRVLKPNGILIIIEHNILNDFDHLIVDIEHSLNSYIYDKKPDDTFTNYFNYMELDFVLNNYGFYWTYGYQMTSNVGFEVRYDNPFYALYINNKS